VTCHSTAASKGWLVPHIGDEIEHFLIGVGVMLFVVGLYVLLFFLSYISDNSSAIHNSYAVDKQCYFNCE
jgi:hypothetical protein